MRDSVKITAIGTSANKRPRAFDPASFSNRYDLLLRMIQAAGDKLDPSQVIESIMDHMQELIACEAWSLLLLDTHQDELVFEGVRGVHAGSLLFARLKMGRGIAGWVAKHRKSVLVKDVRRDTRFDPRFDQKNLFETKSVICSPLISRNQVLGVVELINKRTKSRRFSDRDLQTLDLLVGPIAVSLHNALLFQEVEKLAITDDLTRLFNSRYINQHLDEVIRSHSQESKSLSVIFLDLDGFKTVNDRFGHLVGGKTLVEVGKILFEKAGNDSIVARYGGDEFIVILPETSSEEAVCRAEELRVAIWNHDFDSVHPGGIRLSASFGVSVYPDHATSMTELIQKADSAMYSVKYSGKNAVRLAG